MNRKALFAIAALVASAGAFAQGAARVQTATGVLSVERPGAAPALLSVGSDVQPGDVLRTERDSTAALRFTDGTQVTVRPNTRLVLEGYRYDAGKPANDNFAMRLLKGGMRTVTGLLGKRRPEAFAVRAATATVGIRGTDFVVRMCEDDCAADNSAGGSSPPADGVAARVVVLGGSLRAQSRGQAPRAVALDGAVFASETLTVSPSGIAVIVFRDDTRITLEPGAVLKVGLYEYDAKKPAQGIAEMQLVSGNAQVWTGRIAKVRPDRFRFVAADAPVHVFGTGFSVTVGGVTLSGNADSSGVSGGASGGGGSVSGSASVGPDGANASGSASGGGNSVSGSASVGSGGANGSGTASGGGARGSLRGSTGGLATSASNAATRAGNAAADTGNRLGNLASDVFAAGAAGANQAGSSGSRGVTVKNPGGAATDFIDVTNVPNGLGGTPVPFVNPGKAGAAAGKAAGDAASTAASNAATQVSNSAAAANKAAGNAANNAANTAGTAANTAAGTATRTVQGAAQGAASGAQSGGQAAADSALAKNKGDVVGTVVGAGTSAVGGAALGAVAGGAAGARAGATGGNAAQAGAQAGRDANEAQRASYENSPVAVVMKPVSDAMRGAGQGAVSGAQSGAQASTEIQRSRNTGGAAGDVIANVRGTISGGITGAAAGAAAGAQAGFTGGDATQSGAQAGRDATIANYRDPVGDALRGAGQGAVSGAQSGGQAAADSALARNKGDVVGTVVGAGTSAVGGAALGAIAGGAAGAQAGATGGNAAQAGAQAGKDADAAQRASYENSPVAVVMKTVSDALRGAGQGVVSGAQGAANAGAAAGASAANAARDEATRAMDAQRTTAEAARDSATRTAQRAGSDAAAVGAVSANVAQRAVQDAANPLVPMDPSSNRRSYDISRGTIATPGGPDFPAPPGQLQTIPGEPVVTRDGDRTITVWKETVVPGSVSTNEGAFLMTGSVVRTEVVGPQGTQTTLSFVNIMFNNPVILGGIMPKVGGPLISVDGINGLVIVTNSPPPNTAQTASTRNSASPSAQDDSVKVSASLGRGSEASTIAREATTARDFALKSLRNPMPVTVGVWEGAVQLEGAGGAQMVHKGESAALPEGGGKPIPMEGFQRTGLSNAGLRPDRVNADLAQVFEEDGKAATGPGVYVQVRDGAVELRKDGNLVVLQKGDTGFTDSGSGPLRKFTTPPPFLGRDPFLARGVTRGTGGGGSGTGLMCGPAFGA